MIMDYRRQQGAGHLPIHIGDAEVESVSSFKFLCVHISEDLSRTLHMDTVVKKARQWLCFLRILRKFGMNTSILTNFYSCTIESLLTGYITLWYRNYSAHSPKSQQRVVEAAQNIIGNRLPDTQDSLTISHQQCLRKAHSIIMDHSNPAHIYHLADDTGAWLHVPLDLKTVFTTRPSGFPTHQPNISYLLTCCLKKCTINHGCC